MMLFMRGLPISPSGYSMSMSPLSNSTESPLATLMLVMLLTVAVAVGGDA